MIHEAQVAGSQRLLSSPILVGGAVRFPSLIGASVLRYQLLRELKNGHSAGIRHISWSVSGDALASCADDKLVCVWKADGDLRQSLLGHQSRVTAGSWNQQGRLATVARDHKVIVWNLLTSAPECVVRGSEALSCLCWLDDNTLLTGDEAGNLATAHPERQDRLHIISSHAARIVGVAHASVCSLVIVAYGDGLLRVLSTDLSLQQQVKMPWKIRGIAVADTSLAICGDSNEVHMRSLVDLQPKCIVKTTALQNHCVALADESEQLVAFGNHGRATMWSMADLDQPVELPVSPTQARLTAAAFRPARGVLAVVGPGKRTLQLLSVTPVQESGNMIERASQLNNVASFDVFLSHNSQDKPRVRELFRELKNRDLKPWLDEQELIPGRPWQEALEEIIATTRTAAILFGPSGLGPWEEPEMRGCLNEFVRRKLPVIPVLLPGAPCEPKLPMFLATFTWVDLREGLTKERLDRLQWGITGIKPS